MLDTSPYLLGRGIRVTPIDIVEGTRSLEVSPIDIVEGLSPPSDSDHSQADVLEILAYLSMRALEVSPTYM